MRHLVLARHAKAEAPAPGLADHQRPLTLTGREHAAAFGKALVDAGLIPAWVVASDSARTTQTWKLAAAQCDGPAADLRAALYDTGVDVLLRALREAPADAATVVFVGHEPTVSRASADLAGHGSDTAALKRIAHGLPTGMGAVFEVAGEWADLGPRSLVMTGLIGRTDAS